MPTFFQEVCQAKVEEVQELLAIKNGQIAPTPKTEAERLFDAIIAPYKGKVVVVDFWNTWCNPCLAAHKEIEPLKSSELKSDDIVWIYIADDSSPEATYKEKIQHIKGKHYRFSSEQAKIVKRQFGIKAIPAYVLVEKSGEYKLRDDVGNINTLKSELKKRIDL
ncbi:MAG: TlpA family protein disulfide reductase [Alistipes sp.]|nr:TlpA family protein disulfide reductase [Alistipes sp.]